MQIRLKVTCGYLGDLAFFRKITSETTISGSMNAVLMGRKTWDSIPAKMKPLKNRFNVVISRTLELADAEGQVHISRSFDEAMEYLAAKKTIDKCFIIGGSSIYEWALQSEHCYNIFLTKVYKEFQCDTFFPEFDENVFRNINLPGLDRSMHKENDVEYQFNCYHKTRNTIDVVKSKGNLFVYAVVAMDANRGIGCQGRLPWPPIKEDYEHYLALVRGKSGERVLVIIGRLTWESMNDEEKNIEGVVYIVVTSRGHLISCPDLICSTVPTFNEAISLAADLHDDGLINKVCLLGGHHIYKEGIESGLCKKIYLTSIHETFQSDVYMPEFEDRYSIESDQSDERFNKQLQDEKNGIKFTFCEYNLMGENRIIN